MSHDIDDFILILQNSPNYGAKRKSKHEEKSRMLA